MSQITSLLSVIGQGDMTLIDTTSLVHWSFLRFEKSRAVDIGGRAQFIAHAPRVMRSVVVDAVRRRHSERGGGGAAHVEFDEAVAGAGTGGGRPARKRSAARAFRFA